MFWATWGVNHNPRESSTNAYVSKPLSAATVRRHIEPAFWWLKTIAWLRKVKLRGLANVHWLVCFAAAAFNLRRLTTLMAAPA